MGGRAVVLLALILLVAVTTIYHTLGNKHVLSMTPRTQWRSWALTWQADEHLQDDTFGDAVEQAKVEQLDLGRKAPPNAWKAPDMSTTEHTRLPPFRASYEEAMEAVTDNIQAGKHDWQLPSGWDQDPEEDYDSGVELIGGGTVDYSDELNAVSDRLSNKVEDMIMDSIMSS